MDSLNEFPKIMLAAREDLGATVSGMFSPEDWGSILKLAHEKLNARLGGLTPSEQEEREAWHAVILDFHRNGYWGFTPNYKKVRTKEPNGRNNLGLRFIFTLFVTFTLTKMALAWFGQIYSTSDDPRDGYIFFAVVILVIANFSYLLWKTRNHQD